MAPAEHHSDVILFGEREAPAVTGCLDALARRRSPIHRAVNKHLGALEAIARAVSAYPPIIGEQRLGRRTRSVATLAAALHDLDETNRELRIPAKAVLGRSLFVAKLNFLLMLRRLASSAASMGAYRSDLDDAVLQNVLLLMGEDVFLALIEDERCERELRTTAAHRLARIWEYRLDRDMAGHAPVLMSLWKARRTLRPIYGTMMGASELTRLTFSVEPGWAEFIAERLRPGEAAQAMEEFLFGLSHEELVHLRSVMRKRAIASVSRRRVSAIIGRSRSYTPFEDSDPRRLYEFYRQRSAAAFQRRVADRPGPRGTIEELLLRHLLETETNRP